jgi:molecular chaperone GrpE
MSDQRPDRADRADRPDLAEGPKEREPGRGEDGALATKVAELEDRWRRALADLDNHRKRAARDAERIRAEERARVAAAWLPVLDDLERALAHAEDEPGAVLKGIQAVRVHAIGVLAGLGFPRQEDQGEPFDPTRHEAVATVPGGVVPEGTITEVVRPGYGEGANQLRPALVVVAKGQGDGDDR